MTYSNVGFGLLAIIVERVTGHSFATALTQLVLAPLGIEGYLGVEPKRLPAWVVGELGEHAGTPLSPYNSAFWRRLSLPWGWLVTTAAGALSLVRAFAGMPTASCPLALLAEATHDQTEGLSGGLVRGVLERHAAPGDWVLNCMAIRCLTLARQKPHRRPSGTRRERLFGLV